MGSAYDRHALLVYLDEELRLDQVRPALAGRGLERGEAVLYTETSEDCTLEAGLVARGFDVDAASRTGQLVRLPLAELFSAGGLTGYVTAVHGHRHLSRGLWTGAIAADGFSAAFTASAVVALATAAHARPSRRRGSEQAHVTSSLHGEEARRALDVHARRRHRIGGDSERNGPLSHSVSHAAPEFPPPLPPQRRRP